MAKFEKKELKKKSEDISDWYTDVVIKAELADYGPVKGTMVIRPYGYAIWERVQEILNQMLKGAGVENAYFPLFIPYSLLTKEKEHVAGFSPELALVTKGGGEDLAEPLVVRPTSETIMYEMYKKWIHSWRDLPVLINQWNNVVRWEKRTYLFLRTLEFLWQEGHCAYATHDESREMVLRALDWYRQVYENFYAIPVIAGIKSESEKFAGAVATFAVETLMPDGKALQGATSHDLGQNFSKAQNIKFQNPEGKESYIWQNSWGFSTRTLGALILVHGDDHGLVLPPKIAPTQVVIVPVNLSLSLLKLADELRNRLEKVGISVKVDKRESISLGRKYNHWEVKGVPIRIEIGKKELEQRLLTLARRDTQEKSQIIVDEVETKVSELLDDIQNHLFTKSQTFLSLNTHTVKDFAEFENIMNTSRGFIKAYWCEDARCETEIKTKTKATTRVRPLNAQEEKGTCVHCGKSARYIWYFAQSY